MNRHGTKNLLIEALNVSPSSAKNPMELKRILYLKLDVWLVHMDNWCFYGRPTIRLGLGNRRVGGSRIPMGVNMRGY